MPFLAICHHPPPTIHPLHPTRAAKERGIGALFLPCVFISTLSSVNHVGYIANQTGPFRIFSWESRITIESIQHRKLCKTHLESLLESVPHQPKVMHKTKLWGIRKQRKLVGQTEESVLMKLCAEEELCSYQKKKQPWQLPRLQSHSQLYLIYVRAPFPKNKPSFQLELT